MGTPRFLNLYVQVLDFPDHNDSENEGERDQTEESDVVFDLNKSALHELAGDWLPAGPITWSDERIHLDLSPYFLIQTAPGFPRRQVITLTLCPAGTD